jgi:crotonobetainyl-CoA:carnitine CoA-transferase CaiB-like acyl-CoA transferase
MGISALESLYQTQDGWLCLAVRAEAEIEDMQTRLSLRILDDPRFATPEARVQHRDELTDMLRSRFEQRSTAAWLEVFAGSKVGLAEPADADFVHAFFNDPEQRRLGRVAEAPHPEKGRVRDIDKLIRVSDAEIAPHRLAPDLGGHTDEVLAMLGFPDDYAAGLRAAGKIR